MIVKSISFKGHRCFKKAWSGFDTIKPINVIIGRNNSGKSHLLDLIEALCKGQLDDRGWQYRCRGILDEASLRHQFSESTSEGVLRGNHWDHHGRHFVNVEIAWETDINGAPCNITFHDDCEWRSPFGETSTNDRLAKIGRVVQEKTHQLTGKSFRRLFADRDVQTEQQVKESTLGSDGKGASNIVRRFILSTDSRWPREVIQHELLNALNSIFGNDGEFSEIQVQHHEGENTDGKPDHWEIYLGEEKKGLISLSKSGSGLKTALLVLLNLLAIPKIERKKKSHFVFAFEELENNLHPALLRRLFRYLEKYALDEQATIFLTTHSSTALDFFGTSENAQIIRVVHDGEAARATRVSAHFDGLGVVSELGAKPSDLLQANSIVWVEGPSDRIYLNRWIHLCSEGTLQEGRDYQCVFYGGSLLAQTQFKSPDETGDDLANLFRVNTNIIVVCDGDRSSRRAGIRGRVRRIRAEVQAIPGTHIWITAAREIENYIPGTVLANMAGLSSMPDPGQYENFFPRKRANRSSYVENNMKGSSVDKMELAISSGRHMTRDVMENRFDWDDQLQEIVRLIKAWND